jgi:hypothetical protein
VLEVALGVHHEPREDELKESTINGSVLESLQDRDPEKTGL